MESNVAELTSSQYKKHSLQTDIQTNRENVDRAQRELIDEQRKECQTVNEIKNLQAELSMVDKSIFELESDLRDEQKRYTKVNAKKTSLEEEYKQTKQKFDSLNANVQNQKNLQETLAKSLPTKHQQLIDQQLKQNQYQYEIDQYRNEIKLKILDKEQDNIKQPILNNSIERNQAKIDSLNLQREQILKPIEQHKQSEEGLKKKIEELKVNDEEKKRCLEEFTDGNNNLQRQYDDANTLQEKNLNQLYQHQQSKNDLIIRITKNQQEINDRQVEIDRIPKEKKLKQDELENYQERQAGYPNKDKSTDTITYNQLEKKLKQDELEKKLKQDELKNYQEQQSSYPNKNESTDTNQLEEKPENVYHPVKSKLLNTSRK
jgi:hypothetical protein